VKEPPHEKVQGEGQHEVWRRIRGEDKKRLL